jgi:hypothetical protein
MPRRFPGIPTKTARRANGQPLPGIGSLGWLFCGIVILRDRCFAAADTRHINKNVKPYKQKTAAGIAPGRGVWFLLGFAT